MEIKVIPTPLEDNDDENMKMEVDEAVDLNSETMGDNFEATELRDDNLGAELNSVKFDNLVEQLQEISSSSRCCKFIFKNFKKVSKYVASNPNSSVVDYLINILEKHQDRDMKNESNNDKTDKLLVKFASCFSCEGEMFRTFLKVGMKHGKNIEGGWKCVKILRLLFEIAAISVNIHNPILGIQMMLSHSSAESIFLEFHEFHKRRNNNFSKNPLTDNTESKSFSGHKTQKASELELQYSQLKTELLVLWRTLVKSFSKISKESGTEADKKILDSSVPYLMQMYSASLCHSDREIFSILKLYSSKKLRITLDPMPTFGPKCFETSKNPNPLYAHSIKANSVLSILRPEKAFQTAFNFRENWLSSEIDGNEKEVEEFYDIRFLLPLLSNCLDEKNVCDAVKVITNGWVYFIARGMALEDPTLRNVAFLAFKRLIFNLHLAKGSRLQDVKIWLHFLLSVKNGLVELQKCKISNIFAVWMVGTLEVVLKPTHPLYSKVTHFLLAKPVLDLTTLPEFVPFFNATEGVIETREWILRILLKGLQTREDWEIHRKLPIIKLLCSIFTFEKLIVQRLILNVLANGASIPEVAVEMVDKYGVLLWMANVICDDKRQYKRELEDVYRNLSANCPADGHRNGFFQYVAMKQNWTYLRDEVDCE